jgi:hypothetical protein
MVMNSIQGRDGVLKLQEELSESARVRATNYIGTYFDNSTKEFRNVITNYPLAMPSSVPYYGVPDSQFEEDVDWGVPQGTDQNPTATVDSFPWQGYPGQGIGTPTGPVGPITRRQVIGMAVYRPAAQLGEEYGAMETDRGKTRGKFTELVFDVKHDAWVIPQYSHGILLIVDSQENVGTPTIKVETVNQPSAEPAITNITVTPNIAEIRAGMKVYPTVRVEGVGRYDNGWVATSDDTSVAVVSPDGVITGVTAGTADITFASAGDPTMTDVLSVTVTA